MTYRRLVTWPVAAWVAVATAVRLPNAMAPLAMLFLGKSATGSYSTGSVLAACFVVGEVIGAATLGTLVTPHRLRVGLSLGLLCGAAGFALIVVSLDGPIPLMGAGALIAGASPAISPGALRTLLTDIVEERDVAAAFSAESILTELIWMAAPGLVVALALRVSGATPLIVCAVSLALASGLSLLLRSNPDEGSSTHEPRPSVRVILSGWPVYLTSAAAMSLVAVSELVLPALLQYRRIDVGWSGVLLTAFAGASALGAFAFGLRTWPGTSRTQSLVLLTATSIGITGAALSGLLIGIAAGLLAAGAFQSTVMITRNLSLRELLPERARTAGYSVMYAVQGIGYSLSAVFAGFVLDRSTPDMAIFGGVAITVVLAGISALAERGPKPGAVESEPEETVPGPVALPGQEAR